MKSQRPEYDDMSLLIFHETFRVEEDCFNWLFSIRWSHGFLCPRCEGKKYFKISTRGLYKCQNCNYQVSLTAGTIFHKTKTPLLKWFLLIYRMAVSKTGVSIKEMQRELEIKDYKTAWTMAHKVRKAMSDRDSKYKLAGLIEIDESFWGPSSSGKRGRGAEEKQMFIIAVSIWTDKHGNEKPGFAHAFIADNADADTIENILIRVGMHKNEIEMLISSLRTDGWRSYEAVSKKLNIPQYKTVLKNPKDAIHLLPWTHKLISNVKAVISGPHRGVSKKHFQKYLSEICYRFNRRFWERQAFHRLLYACVTTDTIIRNELMNKRSGELSQ